MTAPISMFDLIGGDDGPARTTSPAVAEVPVRAHVRRITRRASIDATPRPAGLAEREAERRRIRERDQERLLPVVRELATRRGAEGITASEVTAEAITRGIFTGMESKVAQRALSWIGPWLAVLARQGVLAVRLHHGQPVRRRSERAVSHGNLQVCYVAPEQGGDHGA